MSEWLSKEEKKKRINQIRDMTGERNRLSLINITYTDCSVCGYDTIKKEAKDSACPTCGGLGKVGVETTITLLAKIRWLDPLEEQLLKTGYLPTGEVSFTINNKYEDTVDGAEKVEVDGVEVKIINKRYKGSPTVNRITYLAEPVNK